MDREDLDRKLKENGEAMKETSHGSRSSRMKIAALALYVSKASRGEK